MLNLNPILEYLIVKIIDKHLRTASPDKCYIIRFVWFGDCSEALEICIINQSYYISLIYI